MPSSAPLRGVIRGSFDYVLPDEMLEALKRWLRARGESVVHHLRTETAEGDGGDYAIDLWDLDSETLQEVNGRFESVLVAPDVSWVLFLNHEGDLYVGGPPDLYELLDATWRELHRGQDLG
jgi:hypothetical protein